MFYERPNLLFLACRLSFDFLLNGQKMPAFSFCILEENDLDVVNRGCLVYLNHKNTVCWTFASGQSFRISNSVLLLEMFINLVKAFLFVSNHSTWSKAFSSALAREQAPVTATPVLQTISIILEIFVANLNRRRLFSSQTSFVSKSEPKSDLKIQFIGVGENNIINRGTDSNTLKQLTSVF